MKFIKALSLAATLLSATAAYAAQPVALFDQGHGQRFVVEKTGEMNLGGLAEAFRSSGYEVRSTTEPLTPEALTGVSVVVTSGGFVPHKPEETAALKKFVEAGGGLSVMMHIAPTYEGLLSAFGIVGSSGVVHETENVEAINSLDFTAKDFSAHPLFEGVAGVKFYGSWAVASVKGGAEVVARTSKGGWIDLNRNKVRDEKVEPLGQLGLIAVANPGSGRVAAFGDDAVFQDKFLVGDNKKLASNLAAWLGGGKK